MASAKSQPKLVAIVGPTASGKSDLAMKIAQKFNGEIISADSWTVYKGFDIGTAKPSEEEKQAVPHHLLDIREAEQGFNAPLFQKLANAAIEDIQGRSKLPILVGGTGLYVDSVLYDFGFLPNVGNHERKKLDAMALAELISLAQKQDINLDDIDLRNKRRVVRAIEAGGQKPTKSGLRPDTLLVGLQPEPEQINSQIERRLDLMLAAGLEQEVKRLAAKYSWDVEPMKGIGYLQWQEYFAGRQSLETTRQRLISATRDLAKRQRTWFKRNPQINWFNDPDEAYKYVKKTILNT